MPSAKNSNPFIIFLSISFFSSFDFCFVCFCIFTLLLDAIGFYTDSIGFDLFFAVSNYSFAYCFVCAWSIKLCLFSIKQPPSLLSLPDTECVYKLNHISNLENLKET